MHKLKYIDGNFQRRTKESAENSGNNQTDIQCFLIKPASWDHKFISSISLSLERFFVCICQAACTLPCVPARWPHMLFLSILSCFSSAFCRTQACDMHLAPTLPPWAQCDGRAAKSLQQAQTHATLCGQLYGAMHFSSCPARCLYATLAAR